MIKKINFTLGIIAICGALFVGSVILLNHLTDVNNSSIVQQLGGNEWSNF